MPSEMERGPRRSRLAEGLAGAAVAVVSWRLGPPAGVAAEAVQPFVADLFAQVQSECSRKGTTLADGAEAEVRRIDPRITEDEVWEALIGDDQRRAFMVRVLEAARRTGREDKLRALGALLGRVAADGDQIDPAEVLRRVPRRP